MIAFYSVLKVVDDIASAAANRDETALFHSRQSTYPLIDCMFYKEKVFHGFNATKSPQHNCQPHLIASEVQKLELNRDEKFYLYYAVPEEKFEGFTTNPVDPLAAFSKESEHKVILHTGRDQVAVYHLKIPRPNEKVKDIKKCNRSFEFSKPVIAPSAVVAIGYPCRWHVHRCIRRLGYLCLLSVCPSYNTGRLSFVHR